MLRRPAFPSEALHRVRGDLLGKLQSKSHACSSRQSMKWRGRMDGSRPWGKLDRALGGSHHLAHHCADVAACFLGVARHRVVRARLEKAAGWALSATDIERLGMLVFLHDAGKLHPGFQAKGWPDGI